MSALARYSPEQRGVLFASAAAIAVCAAVLVPSYAWLPGSVFGLHAGMEAGERIAFALKADILVFLWLAGCVRAVSSGRFRSPADIRGSAYAPPSSAIAVQAAVLQNSLEQTVLAVGAHLGLAAVLRGDELVLIPARRRRPGLWHGAHRCLHHGCVRNRRCPAPVALKRPQVSPLSCWRRGRILFAAVSGLRGPMCL